MTMNAMANVLLKQGAQADPRGPNQTQPGTPGRGFNAYDAANFGSIGGTAASIATGLPGLGLIGAGIGNAVARSAAKRDFASPYGTPDVSWGSGMLNSLTGGLFGTSALNQGAQSYKKKSGTHLSTPALTAFATRKTYSGPHSRGPQSGGGLNDGYGSAGERAGARGNAENTSADGGRRGGSSSRGGRRG